MKFEVTQTDFDNRGKLEWYRALLPKYFDFTPETSEEDITIGYVELNTIDDILKFNEIVDNPIIIDDNTIEIYNDYRE